MRKEKKREKPTIFLHIGYPKTATTFLQLCIFRELKEVHYIRGPFFSTVFGKIFSSGINKKETRELQMGIAQKIQNKRNLISDEGIVVCGKLFERPEKSLKHILKKLRALFAPNFKIKIILGVREFDGMVASLYKQYVQEGGLWTQEQFVKDTDTKRYEYPGSVKLINDLFGKENVFIYHFEELVKDKKRVVGCILRFMGEKEILEFKDIQYNKSYSPAQLKIARFFNRFFKTKYNPDGFLPAWLHRYFRYALQSGRTLKLYKALRKVRGKISQKVFPSAE